MGGRFLPWGSSQPRDRTWVACLSGRFFTTDTAWEAPSLAPFFTKLFSPQITFHSIVAELQWSQAIF